jgi:uncharacterized repeat protein (TIGR03803 family)
VFTVIHSFDGMDGANPYAALVHAGNGDFYGTTSQGGANADGTIFKITGEGTLTTLLSFNSTDGAFPYSALIQASNGVLYGTTASGGTNSNGTIFQMTPDGTLTTLCGFDGADGLYPYAALMQDTNGKFYGVTYGGGGNAACSGYDGCGTVFSLSVGLRPFVTTLPTSGAVGTAVKILGTNLTGPLSVTFNGTPAAVASMSPSEIKTIVPAGATTGTVQVVTPSGTLSSNVSFRVLPYSPASNGIVAYR